MVASRGNKTLVEDADLLLMLVTWDEDGDAVTASLCRLALKSIGFPPRFLSYGTSLDILNYNTVLILVMMSKYPCAAFSVTKECARHPAHNNSEAAASSLNSLGVLSFHMFGSLDENAAKAHKMLNTRLDVRRSRLSSPSKPRTARRTRHGGMSPPP